MAADRTVAERGFIEIKMGRSKFPGKPSKIGSRKRVNLSSCALPDENDSSKAAKNIYLGLSVFNETFGDNEMVAPGPFRGFSLSEVEEAMAEARLQQKEAEVEHKKQGVHINLWDTFQDELFSITSCANYENASGTENKTILSFDGGGSNSKKESKNLYDNSSDIQPSKRVCNGGAIGKTSLSNGRGNKSAQQKKLGRNKKFRSSRLKLNQLQCSSGLTKSLQSQAAKKLLDKAKMANIEISKTTSAEKKFSVPSQNITSARVMKHSKRFLDDSNGSRRRFLRSASALVKKENASKMVDDKRPQCKSPEKGDPVKKTLRKDGNSELKSTESTTTADSTKSSSTNSSAGKIILREARLQLDKNNDSLLEGPFSSPSASSLCSNSQLRVNQIQSGSVPESKTCGVCGVVRFYRFVELPKKFGVYCCESCQKFISKMIRSFDIKKEIKLQCLKGSGLCELNAIVRNQHFDSIKSSNSISKCQACWLKLCLRTMKMPIKLKQTLVKVLPVNMQMNINLELNPMAHNTTNKFRLNNKQIKDFSWFNENKGSPCLDTKSTCKNYIEGSLKWSSGNQPESNELMSLRKRTKTSGPEINSMFSCQNVKTKVDGDEKARQVVALKGPRVKHVCRSASVVLGQALATFPLDTTPNKAKSPGETVEDCNGCDDPAPSSQSPATVTGPRPDSVNIGSKLNREPKLHESRPGTKDRKLVQAKDKPVGPVKSGKPAVSTGPTVAAAKTKKKANTKAENPVSMDFWESYDPDEICETGFGLIGSEAFTSRAFCFLCGSSGKEKLIHCASCCEPYHEFCIDEAQFKLHNDFWKFDWICPRCTVCFTCGKTSGQQLKCVKCENSYHIECVDRVGGRLLHSPDRPWVCSGCLRCKSCNGVDVSVFVGNLPLCRACFGLRQKGNYCPLCQRCYEDDDYDSKMMECGQCKCWVHAKCEGLSDEKYQVLSFLPESVEYVCRMCCIMPPAPWWLAVEAELKSGYLGVLKALSKNRKACTMLKWSPRKQCTCRQIDFVSRALDFEDSSRSSRETDAKENAEQSRNLTEDDRSDDARAKDGKCQPGVISERKTSIEVIHHPTESLKLTLKIMKDSEESVSEPSESAKEVFEMSSVKCNTNESVVRDKASLADETTSESSLRHVMDGQEDSCGRSPMELNSKRSLLSPQNAQSDSGISCTDDEPKASLTDEETCRLPDDQQTRPCEIKTNYSASLSLADEKRECFCFLDVDSYNSRSKPFSPNLMSIKKKVTTSEYSSLHQFHQDMERMVATTHSLELMDLYHQTIKEIFPWFDPKNSRVQNSSQKVSGPTSMESTPVKNTPVKSAHREECSIPKDKLLGKSIDYFYSDYTVEDTRTCLLCKVAGDGDPGETGRLLYCGQNEWVHCNCALWSGEVFEEIDGSLQNVHSAINRGRSIRCPECNLKGASIGCCARNCQETYHFGCARKIGCLFMDDKTMYCLAHSKDTNGKLVNSEKEFEIRRPVYVELDKRRMKSADCSEIRFAVGALHVNNLGKFILKLSDQSDCIVPDQFSCTRLFWSCYEPWRIVRYHFTVRLVEAENSEGVDMGINLTIDHSKSPDFVDLKLKQLRHFQKHSAYLDIDENLFPDVTKPKCKKPLDECEKRAPLDGLPVKKSKEQKVVRKILEQFDSKEDDNSLSDNQNTADLLPPDIEEAIFKDLPHDILDGISMQDIFMDIKGDSFENSAKDGVTYETCDEDENMYTSPCKIRKTDSTNDGSTQNDFWLESSESKADLFDGVSVVSRSLRSIKRNKLENSQPMIKRATTLKTYQKSSNVNSKNFKADGSNNKWNKKSPKCHVTVNLLEPQERGNMLQELKFTDGLVSISTGSIGSIKDLKARLEDTKRSIQEEGKENKCLSWQTRLQPRLLQVDGGVDSSSSGSEAGESPQRVIEESINPKLVVPPPETSPFLTSPLYSLTDCKYKDQNGYLSTGKSYSYSSSYGTVTRDHASEALLGDLPQVDGANDIQSDSSDSEDLSLEIDKLRRTRHYDWSKRNQNRLSFVNFTFKINQCDGGADSEQEDDLLYTAESSQIEDEPVKCDKCHCTYRTKISYQRHLDSCSCDFILSSSEAELSDEESPRKHTGNKLPTPKKMAENVQPTTVVTSPPENIKALAVPPLATPVRELLPQVTPQNSPVKVEVKKEKNKRTYIRKKAVANVKKPIAAATNGLPQVQQILVQQPNGGSALIVQDVSAPNVVPAGTAFIDSTPALGYVTAVNSQNPFGKTHLIATPNGLISGSFQLPTVPPEPQLLGGLCINPQGVQTTFPGFIIQPQQAQHAGPGTLISPQPGPMMVSNEQMMLGSGGLFAVQDPRTGGMFLTSHNQPVFYNMETIVSNTVMQTNQFVSNVLGTTFSQTSTQIFQASEQMEQIVNVPSNYILVNPSLPTQDRFVSADNLLSIQTPQTVVQNPNPIQIANQSLFNPPLQTAQTFAAEPKILAAQLNPVRCIQPVCPSIVLGKIQTSGNGTSVSSNSSSSIIGSSLGHLIQKAATPTLTLAQSNIPVKGNSVVATKSQVQVHVQSQPRSVQMMRTTTAMSPGMTYEKATITPKIKLEQVQPRSRALVEYINNFRSDMAETISSIASPTDKEPPPHTNDGSAMKTQSFNATSKPSDQTPVKLERPLNVENSLKKTLPIPQLVGTNESDKSHIAVTPKIESEPVVCAPPETKVSSPSKESKESVQPDKNSSSPTIDLLKAVQTIPKSLDSHEVSGMKEPAEVKADAPTSPPQASFSPMSNSQVETKAKTCLSMPDLDDTPVPPQVEKEREPAVSQPVERNNNNAFDILPLQDNSQTVNTGRKSSSKSPPKVNSIDSKGSEERRHKRKLNSNDQNLLVSDMSRKESSTVEDTPMMRLRGNGQKFPATKKCEGPKLIFDVTSDDGYKSSSTSMAELWANICGSVQEMRAVLKIPPLPVPKKGYEVLGMHNHGLQHCLEQLKGVEQCVKYKCKYFQKEDAKKDDEEEVRENLSGCARTEPFNGRKEYDMFAWLASKHRKLPKLTESAEETLSSIRRANNLPMAMRYRNLKETAKLYVGVYRSRIHGRGLFCLREIEAGEMVIEYAGEVIRSNLTDKREKYYTDKGIGCYMFRIDDHFVVDATMKGNAARFINHSCEPNCYSRVVDILGKKHIVIFALRRINIMEELTYDYKFPFEDEKISCHCLSKKCRKYLN